MTSSEHLTTRGLRGATVGYNRLPHLISECTQEGSAPEWRELKNKMEMKKNEYV